MGYFERSQSGFSEFSPPENVMVEEDHWLQLSAVGTHIIDIRHLPRPLTTIVEGPETEITTQEHKTRDEYLALCKSAYGTLWHEIETFIATTSLDEATELGESATFDTHLAFDELVQNAFRYGGRPQRVSVSLVRATDAYSYVPRQPKTDDNNVHLYSQRAASATGDRILLGVQDSNPEWKQQVEVTDDELPEHLRGLDIIRGISQAVWYQPSGYLSQHAPTEKWVWTLI